MKPPSLRTYRPVRSRLAVENNFRSALLARHIHRTNPRTPQVNELGVPLSPTWSVRELLDSYPPPAIDDQTFEKIHRLSALVPPAKGTAEREFLRKELQELVKMVNAVRIADIPKDEEQGVPDGRIYPIPIEVSLEETKATEEESQPHGRELLRHSQISSETSYVLPNISKQRESSS